jgi:hypothetical protein
VPNDLVESRRWEKLAVPILPQDPAVAIKASPIGTLIEEPAPISRAGTGKFAFKLFHQANGAQFVQVFAIDASV